MAEKPKLDGDRANDVGDGKHVIAYTPASTINHACDPSRYFRMMSTAVYGVHAFRNIVEREELTHTCRRRL